MRKNILSFSIFITVFISLIALLPNCKKFDQNLNGYNQPPDLLQLKQQFFNTSNADAEVKKVADDIKKQDAIFKFLPDFIKKNGVPKWDKVFYQVQKGEIIIAGSEAKNMSSARSSNIDENASQGIFLIPLQSATSTDIQSYITAYKHNDSLYTYRLYNKDSLSNIHPDSIQSKRNLLNVEAVFGYFEKTINGKDSISVTAPTDGRIKNVQIGFSNSQNNRNNTSTRTSEMTCAISMTLTVEYEWREFTYCYGGCGTWVAVSAVLEITLTCTGDGGGGCGCQGLGDLNGSGTGNYWWQYGTGWPWYNTGSGSTPGYYLDPNAPWYPWWTNNSGINPFPSAELIDIDVSQINDPCLEAVIAAIGAPGHRSFILRTYDQQQYTPSTVHKYKVKYETDNNLVGSNGQPAPGHTIVNVLPDGTNEVVITLNPTLFQNTSKEWVTTVILHELVHGILTVNRADLNTQKLQHINMFDNKAPITIWQSLHELFPNLAEQAGIALGMDGLSDAYLIDDPNNPGTQIIDPVKDLFALRNDTYGQNINLAVSTAASYQFGTSGTPFC